MNKAIKNKIRILSSDDEKIDNSFIIGLTKALNSARFSSCHYSEVEINILLMTANSFKKEIDKNLEEKGLNYLKKLIRKDGEPRLNKGLGKREVEIIRNFKRFLFVGVIDASDGRGHAHTPLWRVEAKGNRSFTYYADPLDYFKITIVR